MRKIRIVLPIGLILLTLLMLGNVTWGVQAQSSLTSNHSHADELPSTTLPTIPSTLMPTDEKASTRISMQTSTSFLGGEVWINPGLPGAAEILSPGQELDALSGYSFAGDIEVSFEGGAWINLYDCTDTVPCTPDDSPTGTAFIVTSNGWRVRAPWGAALWRTPQDNQLARVVCDTLVQGCETGCTGGVWAFQVGANGTIDPNPDFTSGLVSACVDPTHTPTPTSITSPTSTSIPTPSPTASNTQPQIAFETNRDGNHEIYVMSTSGSGQTNLTNNPAIDVDPTWSSDGTRIAFGTDRDGNGEIYIMNPDGSGVSNLTNSVGWDYDPAWSPDGTRIAFVSDRNGNPEIYVMNADGSKSG